ncbi:MAG: ABC transporter transmembrane domain-containing protein, partial [Alphaproteobacteria bacterium]|nr:ABC transporter transmembrane domain-containing protein [Alphaproteobacteria bacterium]
MAAHSGTALMPSVLAILAWSRRDPRAAVLLVLCSGVIASGNIVLALAIAQAMEAFTTTAALAQATWPLVVLIAAGSVRGLVGLLRGMMLRRLRYRVIREQDDALVSGLLVGARNSGEGASPGAAARALAAGDRAGELLFGDVTSALAELAVAPVIVAILWHFHPAMALVGVLVAVLNLLLIRRFVSIDGQLGQTRATAQQRVAGLLESDLRSIETIRMTRTEPEVARGWQNAVVAEFDVLRHAGKFGEAIAASQTALAMLMGGIALGVGGGLMVLSPGFGF